MERSVRPLRSGHQAVLLSVGEQLCVAAQPQPSHRADLLRTDRLDAAIQIPGNRRHGHAIGEKPHHLELTRADRYRRHTRRVVCKVSADRLQ